MHLIIHFMKTHFKVSDLWTELHVTPSLRLLYTAMHSFQYLSDIIFVWKLISKCAMRIVSFTTPSTTIQNVIESPGSEHSVKTNYIMFLWYEFSYGNIFANFFFLRYFIVKLTNIFWIPGYNLMLFKCYISILI